MVAVPNYPNNVDIPLFFLLARSLLSRITGFTGRDGQPLLSEPRSFSEALFDYAGKKEDIMKRYLPDTIDKWGAMLSRVYELQGSLTFEKYQYSIASILRSRASWELTERMLEHVKDISSPKDVLIDEISAIMLDDNVNINTRIFAADALRVLLPKRISYATSSGAYVVRAMRDILNSPQTKVFHDAVSSVLESIDAKMRQWPKGYVTRGM